MNGQQRDAYDHSKINVVKQVTCIRDHDKYKVILYIRPFWDTHLGYLDDVFFGYKNSNQHKMVLEPMEAINYYLNKVPEIFRNPGLEYDMFYSNDLYKPSINALNLIRDNYKKKNKKDGHKATS